MFLNHSSGGFPYSPGGLVYSTTTIGFDGLGYENYFFSSPYNCRLVSYLIRLFCWLILCPYPM